MPSTPIYNLPKNLRKRVLLACYNALRANGKTHEQARHKISHEVICARLIDLEHLIDVAEYL